MRLLLKTVLPVAGLLFSGAAFAAAPRPTPSKEPASEQAIEPVKEGVKEAAKAPAKDSNKDSNKKKSDKSKNASGADKEPEKLSFPVPVGHDAKGLTLPSYGPDGKKKMNFTIGVARRVDEQNVDMNSLQVDTFEEDGGPSLNMSLPVSSFNLATRVLTTHQEVVITRSDFTLTGKTMEFDTRTGQGRLSGGVKMVVYGLASESSGDSQESEPEKKPNPVPKVAFPGAAATPSIQVKTPKTPTNQNPPPRE